MLAYLTLIFVCQLAGELVAVATGWPVPGPVIGMMLLFVGLAVRGSLPASLGGVADGLLGSLSLLFDTQGTLKAGNNTQKTLCWYENLGHAARLLDVVRLYADLDRRQEVA